MDYRLHYRGFYQSPMRDRHTYQVDIYTDGYVGEVLPLRFAGEGISVEYGVTDDDEVQTIKSTSLTLSLLVMPGEDLSELYDLNPLKHNIIVSRDSGTMLHTIFWGYLSMGSYSQPYKDPPYPLTLEANDGIAALEGIKYQVDNKTLHNDTISLDALFDRLLAPIGHCHCDGLPKVSVTQSLSTGEVVGVPSAAIYASYDGVPSHYEVLQMLLSQFALQLSQVNGSFSIRPLVSIASKANAIPIYADDGSATGMSTSSVMSMLPPLQSVSITRKSEDNGREITSMTKSAHWRFLGVNGTSRADGSEATCMSSHGLRLRALADTQGAGNISGVWLYTFDGFVRESPATVEVAMELYNLLNSTATIYTRFFLVERDTYEGDWMTLLPYADVLFSKGVQMWTGGVWETKTNRWGWSSILTSATNLPALEESQHFFRPRSLEKLTKTEVSHIIKGIPASSIPRRLVMMVTSSLPFAMEIANPTLRHTDVGDVEVDIRSSEEVTINPFGTGNLSISQEFRIGEESPVASAVAPYIYNIESNTAVTGYVVPSMSTDYAISMASQLRVMRSDVTIQLEGDIYPKGVLTLHSVLKDREGRYYYPNRLLYDLRRGLYNAQLRELAQLRSDDKVTVDRDRVNPANCICFDAGYISLSGRNVVLHNVLLNTVTPLMEVTGTATLYKGVQCAVVVDAVGDTYNIYAFDHNGNEVSVIMDVRDKLSLSVGNIRTALFDLTTSSWWVMFLTTGVMHTFILSEVGDVIASKSAKGAADISGAFAIPHQVVWQVAGANKQYTTYIFDLTKDKALTPRTLNTNAAKYVDVTETFILEAPSTGTVIKTWGGTPIAALSGTYVGANSAIVLSMLSSNRLRAFDARSNTTQTYGTTLAGDAVLCGDSIYEFVGDTMQRYRVE